MQVYLVGGAVRDHLLGIDSYDKDWVVVGATPEIMLSQGYTAVGKDFLCSYTLRAKKNMPLHEPKENLAQATLALIAFSIKVSH